ncbi:MAG: polysaccharide pyruvyl transferase family protein [Mariniphaga sp.]
MKTITIINQYSGNKGDRAVCYFILTEILKLNRFNIVLSTNDRNNWKNEPIIKNNKIKLVPWGWNVENFIPKRRFDWERRRFFRLFGLPYLLNRLNNNKKGLGLAWLFINKEFKAAINISDIILSTGGHHLTTKFTPDCHNELLFDLAAVTLLNRNLIFWSQTFGPFDFKAVSNENAVRNILNRANHIYIRDIKSFEVLRALKVSEANVKKTYESVIGLNTTLNEYKLPSKRENLVGITVYNAESRTEFEYQQYCRTIAQITDWLIKKGFNVKFFPHEIKGAVVDDRKCINDILSFDLGKENVIIEQNDLTTEQHLAEIMKCKVFIGHKTHSVIFALTVGTPLIAISYHPKTIDFLKEYKLEENLIKDDELNIDRFISVFNFTYNNLDNIGLHEFEKSSFFAKSIQNDLKEELLKIS